MRTYVVVHEPVVLMTHAKPSSIIPSQSSSCPLHLSAGGAHDVVPSGWQVDIPIEPQLEVQAPPAAVCTHMFIMVLHVSTVHATASSQSVGPTNTQPNSVSQFQWP